MLSLQIRMHDEDTDEILVFPCRRWLSRDEGDREICREIPANKKGEPQLPGNKTFTYLLKCL